MANQTVATYSIVAVNNSKAAVIRHQFGDKWSLFVSKTEVNNLGLKNDDQAALAAWFNTAARSKTDRSSLKRVVDILPKTAKKVGNEFRLS